MLKGVATSILGEGATQSQPSKQESTENQNPFSSLNLNQSDLNMMLKAKQMFEKMNSTTSKNADLILALKPHLSPESKEKADRAIRILKLFEILPYIKEIF